MTKRLQYAIYIIIFIAQIAVILYWASAKTNYFIDELYSMERAVSYSGQGNVSYYIQETSDWKMDEWMDNSELKKYLIVTDEEKLFNLPLATVIGKILTGRSYNGLLNIAMSIAGYSVISARAGIALNLLLIVLAELFLIFLMGKLDMGFGSKCMSLVMFGFSGYILGIAGYIRFYSMVIWLLMMIFTLFYVVWSDEKMATVLLSEVGIFVLTYLSYRHTELTIPYFGALSLCFLIGMILTKQWKKVASFCTFILVGMIYIISSTNYLDAIIRPSEYTGSSVVSRIAGNLLNPSFEASSYYFSFLKKMFADQYFGHGMVLILAICSVCVYMIISCKVITLDFRNFQISKNSGYVLIVLGAGIIYTIFAAIEDFSDGGSRYNFFNFVCFAIVFWYIVDRLLVRIKPKLRNIRVNMIVAFWVVIAVLMPFITRNVDYIYEDDAPFKERIEQHSDSDVVLYVMDLDGDITNHEAYDCINQMPSESSIYATDLLTYNYDKVDYPDSFILWSKNGYDLSGVLSDLGSHDYNIEDLGINHISCAYYVSR